MGLLLFWHGAGAPTPPPPPPGSATVGLDVCLGGSFRQILVDEQFVVGCWPLAEIARGTARNIVRNRLHGTYVGGPQRGVNLGLPEGGLGIALSGTDYVEVADDSADALLLNMSLANGDFDVYFLFSTTTNDGTLRCIVHKQTSGSASNGWHAAIQNGALKGFLRVAGVTIFTVTSASGLADGEIHLGHLNYRAGANVAQWYVDGVASGSSASGSTEPAVVGGALRIGRFNDGAGGFIGTLGYVTIGREGNETLSTALQAAREWTSLTAVRDVRSTVPISLRYGIPGGGPQDRVASTGTLQFGLDNSETNSTQTKGYYSPGHPSCRPGFDLSIPVRLVVTDNNDATDYYKFRGVIRDVAPSAGAKRERIVNVTCVDWMDVAADTLLAGVETQVSQPAWVVFGVCVDAADRAPVQTLISTNTETFPYALDSSESESMPALTEFQRICQSDFSKIYIKGNQDDGGVLVLQDREQIQSIEIAATFDNTMLGLEFAYERDAIINKALATYYPRTVGGGSVVLFALDGSRSIKIDETIEVDGPYTDPAEVAVRVGRTLAATTTTVAVNTASDGSGTDITADCEVVTDAGANRVVFTITNRSPYDGYVTQAQLEGVPIYFYDPQTVPNSDGDSIRRHGVRGPRGDGALDMPYQDSPEAAAAAARFVVVSYSTPLSRIKAMTIAGNASADLMLKALSLEPGDVIQLREAMVSGSTYRNYYIHEVSMEIAQNSLVFVSFALAPVNASGGWWTLGSSALGTETVLAWGI